MTHKPRVSLGSSERPIARWRSAISWQASIRRAVGPRAWSGRRGRAGGARRGHRPAGSSKTAISSSACLIASARRASSSSRRSAIPQSALEAGAQGRLRHGAVAFELQNLQAQPLGEGRRPGNVGAAIEVVTDPACDGQKARARARSSARGRPRRPPRRPGDQTRLSTACRLPIAARDWRCSSTRSSG